MVRRMEVAVRAGAGQAERMDARSTRSAGGRGERARRRRGVEAAGSGAGAGPPATRHATRRLRAMARAMRYGLAAGQARRALPTPAADRAVHSGCGGHAPVVKFAMLGSVLSHHMLPMAAGVSAPPPSSRTATAAPDSG